MRVVTHNQFETEITFPEAYSDSAVNAPVLLRIFYLMELLVWRYQ